MTDPVEIMARAVLPEWFGESGKLLSNYPGQDELYQERAKKYAIKAIDALEASGWRLVHPDHISTDMYSAILTFSLKKDSGGTELIAAAIRAAPTYGAPND